MLTHGVAGAAPRHNLRGAEVGQARYQADQAAVQAGPVARATVAANGVDYEAHLLNRELGLGGRRRRKGVHEAGSGGGEAVPGYRALSTASTMVLAACQRVS